MERILTVSEAARELGRSERWLRKAEAKGKIPKARRVYVVSKSGTVRPCNVTDASEATVPLLGGLTIVSSCCDAL